MRIFNEELEPPTLAEVLILALAAAGLWFLTVTL